MGSAAGVAVGSGTWVGVEVGAAVGATVGATGGTAVGVGGAVVGVGVADEHAANTNARRAVRETARMERGRIDTMTPFNESNFKGNRPDACF